MTETPQPKRELPAELVRQYRESTYRFRLEGRDAVMHVDIPSAQLDRAHRAHGVDCSAFLTAWNPRSEPRDERENEARNRALQRDVEAMGLAWLPARGVAADQDWEEASILIFGIGKEDARALAAKYGQNAFLYAGADAVPRLIFTRSTS